MSTSMSKTKSKSKSKSKSGYGKPVVKSKVVLALIYFFNLHILGIDRFYMGAKKSGMMQLGAFLLGIALMITGVLLTISKYPGDNPTPIPYKNVESMTANSSMGLYITGVVLLFISIISAYISYIKFLFNAISQSEKPIFNNNAKWKNKQDIQYGFYWALASIVATLILSSSSSSIVVSAASNPYGAASSVFNGAVSYMTPTPAPATTQPVTETLPSSTLPETEGTSPAV